ncbi:MAG: hypothetical protein Kow0059_19600 [Candidatus Sumerlaeia bacterium]
MAMTGLHRMTIRRVCRGWRSAAACAVLAALILLPRGASADKIVLKTGTTIEGHIVSERDDLIVVFTNGMELPIQRSRIESIERGAGLSKEEQQGDAYLSEGDYPRALEAFRAALAIESTDEGRRRLDEKIKQTEADLQKRDDLRFGPTLKQAAAHIQKRQFAEAERLLNSVLDQHPAEATEKRIKEQLARIYYTRALDALNLIDYTTAQDLLEKAIRLYPDFVEAHKKRAEMLEQKSATYNQAIDAYRRVWEIGRDSMSAKDLCQVAYKLGNLSRELHEYESAIDYYEVILEKCPDEYFDVRDSAVACHVALARDFYGKNDLLAKQHLTEALDLKPYDNDVRLLMARLDLRLNNFTEALTHYEKLMRDGVAVENMNYEMGFCYKKTGNAKMAESAMERELTMFPDNLDAIVALGELFVDGGKYDEALALFRRARQIDAGNYRAALGTGRALRLLKRYSEAEQELLKALEASPTNFEANFELGLVYKELQKFQKAKDYFTLVIDRITADGATTPETTRILAEAYIWRGDANRQLQLFQTAVNDFRQSLELRPNNSNAYFQMGEAYRSLEAYGKAEDCYNKALALSPNNADYYLALAFLYHQNLKNKDRACQYYHLYIDNGGKRANVSRFLDELGC